MTDQPLYRDEHHPKRSSSKTDHFSNLWKITLPLMLSSLSGTLMLFIDRIMLAQYSIRAMNCVVTASTVFFIFLYGSVSIAAIAEVFVGQYNGAKQYSLMGRPVWQMIWFSLFCQLGFMAVGIWACSYLIPPALAEDGVPYLRYLLMFGGVYPLVGSLSAFYIGRTRVKIVTLSVLLGSGLNLIFDYILIFGVDGWIPAMGAKGAAIGTVLAQSIVALLLIGCFLCAHNRQHYGTGQYHFNPALFRHCLSIGLPNSLAHILSITAWSLAFRYLASVDIEHYSIFAIAQSIWLLFSFVTDSLSKGTTALSSNLIGARLSDEIENLFKSAIWVISIFTLILSVPLLFKSEYLLSFFLPEELSSEQMQQWIKWGKIACLWVWGAFFFEGLSWIICGILTSCQDTRFIMITSTICAWLFGYIPIYFCVKYLGFSPSDEISIFLLFTLVSFVIYFYRYQSKPWTTRAFIGS